MPVVGDVRLELLVQASFGALDYDYFFHGGASLRLSPPEHSPIITQPHTASHPRSRLSYDSRSIIISAAGSFEQGQQSRLESSSRLDLPEPCVHHGLPSGLHWGVDEVAPLAIHAVPVLDEHPAPLGLVLGVGLLVLAQLVRAVGELALPLVGAVAELHELPAELRLLLVAPGAGGPGR